MGGTNVSCQLTVPDPDLETRLQVQLVSLAWRLDREMRRGLILHETGFTR